MMEEAGSGLEGRGCLAACVFHMRRRLWISLSVLCLILVGAGIAIHEFINSLEPKARARVVQAIADRFDADVELKSLDLSLFPKPTVVGEGLAIRHKQWTDPQPLIYIARFTASTDFSTILNRKNNVGLLKLEGLTIHIPPRGPSSEKEQMEDNEPVESGEPGHDTTRLRFLIDTIIADGTVLDIAPKIPGRDPLSFDIAKLRLHSVGPGQAMSFIAKLTNAKPPGLIDTTGSFGPWQRDDPRATPVSGKYTFQNADLGVFKGIGGTLSSIGRYYGVLQHIEVDGSTKTPNFSLKRGGDPVNLETTFHSIVNGTDGDTILDPVDAKFLRSEFVCKGGVVHHPGENGKTVDLQAYTTHAQMEDILKLVVGGEPVVTGGVDFKTHILIPPGHQDVIDKLNLQGQFTLFSAQFTSRKVQQRIDTLSDRARGISKDEEKQAPQVTVASNLQGRFKLDNGVASFSQLSFQVPGALIRLAGNYNLQSGKIGMQGTFSMKATLSDTQSGIKHWLLKPLDPLFAKNGAGFQVPIKITGTREHPEIKADVFHREFTIH